MDMTIDLGTGQRRAAGISLIGAGSGEMSLEETFLFLVVLKWEN